MELYYKVSKDSKTGKAFLKIIDGVEKFRTKAKQICEKYGISEMYRIGWDLCGVYTCVFKQTPDRTDWKKVDDGYMPKVRSKNKELLQDFAELKKLTIKHSEIDNLLGLDNPFHQVGYEIFDDCIVFITDDKNDIKHQDAVMISNVEYINMIIDLEKQLTIILLNQGWTKKDISMPGEVHFTKSINAFMLIEVVITSNQNNFLNISIYNTTGIGKEHIIQKYSKIFSKWHIQSVAMRLDSTIPMLIEDVVVEFIKSILQKK